MIFTVKPYGWGIPAMQSLLLSAAQKQRDWMEKNPVRHGGSKGRSIPLAERLTTNNFSEHSSDGSRRPVEEGQAQGDMFGLLIRLIQTELQDGDFLQRCGDQVPRAATDPQKLPV